MSAAKMVPIRFLNLLDMGLRQPPMLFGQLSHNELITAKLLGEDLGSVTWQRHPLETAEQFEERIISDLKELSARDDQRSPVVATA